MNRQELVDGLDFNYQAILDHEVDDVAPSDLYPLVLERDGEVAAKRDCSKRQLVAQAALIAGFQQAPPEMAVHLDSGTDGTLADSIGGMLDETVGSAEDSEHENNAAWQSRAR